MTARPIPRLLRAAAAPALALAVLAGCSGGTGGETESTAPATLAHVHGLGVDPDGGKTYVATHHGLYTVSKDSKPELVGDRRDDYMGFTVTDDGTFLASGHPEQGSDRPANLGLIQSKDAGRTWTSLSLSGEADFHSLEYAAGTVYGYEGGRIRATTDRKTWDDRAQLQAIDLAVSPDDPDELLAATPEGVLRSTDGGRTFADAAGEPGYLSWPAKDALFAIDANGTLSRSKDGGKSWKQAATVSGGTPEALTAVDAEHILAATLDGVYESRDGGETFNRLIPLSTEG